MIRKRKARQFHVGDIVNGLEIVESPDDTGTKEINSQRRYKVKCAYCGQVREVGRVTLNQRLMRDRKGETVRHCQKCAPKDFTSGKLKAPQKARPVYAEGWGWVLPLGKLGHRYQTSNHHEST
jgi:hypothetical protein